MNYVQGTLIQANEHKEIYIKARGKAINKAVDVAEVTTKRFLQNYEIKEIKTGTEKMENIDEKTKEKQVLNVSTISIKIERNV